MTTTHEVGAPTRAVEYRRSEGQYLDIVDFITNNPNTEITASAYLSWPHRSGSVDWGADTPELLAQRVLSRLEHLALSALLPQRPDKMSASRHTVWLQELLRAGGAFYRTRRGVYILDTAAAWRRTSGGVTLADNRWPHYPPASVRKAMPTRAPKREPARRQEPSAEQVATRVDTSMAPEPELASPTLVTLRPAYIVEAAGETIGSPIVLRHIREDGTAVLLLGQVSSVISAVTP